MSTIYQIDSDDRRLLSIYSEIDRGSGAAFADDDCAALRDDWREIVHAEIARHARKHLVGCFSPDGFSLHAPESTDDDIASGEAPYLISAPGYPNNADFAAAWVQWVSAKGEDS
jgi:hypothetical protein